MKDLFCSDKNNYYNVFSASKIINHVLRERHPVNAKLMPFKQRYPDLEIFRQIIDESHAGLHHQPYTNFKKYTLIYRLVFFGFAAVFLILGVIAAVIPSALGCGFLFNSCMQLKGILVAICTIFSLASSTLALSLKAEREAVTGSVIRTKAHLATVYTRKKFSLGTCHFFSFFGQERQKAAALKQLYQEACDKMNDKKDAALHLVRKITTAETISPQQKEQLLNQAIEELNEQLHQLEHNFRHSKIQ